MLFGNFAEARSKDFSKETIDEEESAENYGYLSDSDLEDDNDGRVVPAVVPREEKALRDEVSPVAVPRKEKNTLCEEHEEHVEKGKIVKIPDMAFVT